MIKKTQIGGINLEKLYLFFKYTVYLLLFLNIFYWLQEDYVASSHTYRDGISWQQVGNAFAQAMDSFAWFILLMIFELETAVISDKKLTGKLKCFLNTLAGICYIFILFAFVGYATKFLMAFAFQALPYSDSCAALSNYHSYVIELDDYAELTTLNCTELIAPLFGNIEASLIATANSLYELKWLASAEALNAGAWVLVVLLLWIDVFIQLKGIIHGPLYRINMACKAVLYVSLVVICIYLAFEAPFMEFWDAFLWVVAFFFIELNIFKWAEEIQDNKLHLGSKG